MTSDLLLLAANGTVPTDAQWIELRAIILAKLAEVLHNHLVRIVILSGENRECIGAIYSTDARGIRKVPTLVDPTSLSSRPPYTVQRVCELILSPPGTAGSLYESWDKYLFAMERTLYVTSKTKANPMDID